MNQEIKLFRKLLKANGLSITKPRLRLFRILQNNPALSINQLIGLLNRHDQATVYRNIIVFERLGVISKLQLGWSSKLELSDMFQHHHHHLTCLKCGDVVTLPENDLVEKQIAKLAKTNNFKITDHQLEISGFCRRCDP